MVSHVHTIALSGIEARRVDVQVQVTGGMGAFTVVGLPDKAVSEARERVRAALHSAGLAFPPKRITVNLSPADLPKEGSHFDLPIALGLMMALGAIPEDAVENAVVLGELSLDGRILGVPGVLPAALHASAEGKALICPAASGPEAAWAGDIEIIAPMSLIAFVNHVKGNQLLGAPVPALADDRTKVADLRDIRGQEVAKRALEVAAAGGHNLLLIGPPGAGKSMLAERLPGILPPLEPIEALEVSLIRSVAGELANGAISRQRPFAAPHHSASMPALAGGGAKARPGAVSLAHKGVLFLDELPEFQRSALEALRQPLEAGKVTVARAAGMVTYPARFQLVAAMNPCRCGNLQDAALACSRAPRCAGEYQARISGPLFDRIDLHVDVPPVMASDLALPPAHEGTAEIAARVAAAREIQIARYNSLGRNDLFTNAEMPSDLLEEVAAPDERGKKLLLEAMDSLRLSARAYHRILKVARTLADLSGSETIARPQIAEALSYRRIAPGGGW